MHIDEKGYEVSALVEFSAAIFFLACSVFSSGTIDPTCTTDARVKSRGDSFDLSSLEPPVNYCRHALGPRLRCTHLQTANHVAPP
jgi:hypothetical protein